jgi:rhodanese-related sulfurtransferase
MEIALFQLENLLLTQSKFILLDLRETLESPPELGVMLKRAVRVSGLQVQSYLQDNAVGPDLPLILLCEQGRRSTEIAVALENHGFKNVYVVAGGVAGLLSELR